MIKKILLLLVFPIGTLSIGNAQNNWDGDNPSGNISFNNNWFGDTFPSTWNSSTDLIFQFRNSPSQTSLFHDSGWRAVRSIIFANTFPAALPFDGNGSSGFDFWFKIENNSSHTQTFNIPLSGKGIAMEFNPINANLVFNNSIFNDNNVNHLVFGNNSNRVTFNTPLIGTNAKLILREYSIAILNANNTYTGNTEIDRGELWIEENGTIASGTTVFVGNGGQTSNVAKFFLADANGGQNFNRAININQGNNNTRFIGSLNTSGTNTLSSPITKHAGTHLFIEVPNAGGTFEITGGMAASIGNTVKLGPGTLRVASTALNGAGDNTFFIRNGTVEVDVFPGNLLATSGRPMTLGDDGLGTLRVNSMNASYSGDISISSNNGRIEFNSSNSQSFSGTINFNANTLTAVVQSTNNLTLSGNQTGTGILNINSTGTGAVILTRSSYDRTGNTFVNSGELKINPNSNATYASKIVLNGGTLSTTGITSDRTFTSSAPLQLTTNSNINLSNNSHTLSFVNSSGESWNGTLTITGWNGTAGVTGSGSAGRIFIGTNNLSLTTAQLNSINFLNYAPGAELTSSGELVPRDYAIFYSKGSLAPQLTSSWSRTMDGTGSSPSNFSMSNARYIIQNGHHMTTTAAWTITGVNSVLRILNGGTMQSTFEVTIPNTGTFEIQDGGTYIHDNNVSFATTIFQGNTILGNNSTIELRNWNSIGPNLPTYGNLIFNATGVVGASIQFSSSIQNIYGNLIVLNTGLPTVREIRLTSSTYNNTTVQGNFIMSGGSFALTSANANSFLLVNGDVSLTGGIFKLNTNTTGKGLLICSGQNFEISSNLTLDGANPIPADTGFYFNHNGTQNVTIGQAFTSGNYRDRFFYNASQNAINETYNGIVAQATVNGTGATPFSGFSPWPIDSSNGINNLTISNTSGVTLRNNRRVGNDVIINNGGHLQVNSGISLTVVEDFINNSGTATFEDGASLVQINGTTANNSGNITYKRSTNGLKHLDFVYWGSMVENQTILGIWMSNASENFYRFNAASNAWQGVPGSHVMLEGIGYIARARYNSNGWAPFTITPPGGVIWDASFIGKPRSGNVNVALTGGNQHLLGNPYPSAVDFDLFAKQDTNLGDPLDYSASPFFPTIYYWTQTTPIVNNQYEQNDYATYSAPNGTGTTVGTFTATKNIAAGQGFFVQARPAATAASFKNSYRVTGNNGNFARMTQTTLSTLPQRSRYWLNFNSGNAFKQTAVVHSNYATNGYDLDYDSGAINGNTAMNFYTHVNNINLAIQGRAQMQLTDVVPLGYTVTGAGSFSISLADYDGVFASSNQDIFLQDNVLNVIHNLKTAPYTFVSEAGTFNTRFTIVYQNIALSNPDFNAANHVVVASDDFIKVYSGLDLLSNIEVFDLVGRLIATKTAINSNETALIDVMPTNSPLVIKITLENGKQTTKKIIY